MTAREKLQKDLERVQNADFSLWLKVRRQANDEVSAEHSMFCVCGKLCTGLHESYCKQFKEKVQRRAIKYFDKEFDLRESAEPVACGGDKCVGACSCPPCVDGGAE